ncbi:acyl-CoA dehydrogenase [Hyphomonas oceanitis]|uniref:acyl-CoA dehydrogenase n=1 Tax=Hyphomonas oceanitis TaxID=81033 RepID=UPI00300366FF
MELEEREQLRQVTTRLADSWDPAQAAADGQYDLAETLWAQLAELGLLGIAIPESLGGSEAGIDAEIIVLESLASVAGPVPLSAVYLAGHVLAHGDNPENERLAAMLSMGVRKIGVGLSARTGLTLDLQVAASGQGHVTVTGEVSDLLDGLCLDEILVHIDSRWWVIDLTVPSADRVERDSLDRTRPLARLSLANVPAREISGPQPDQVLSLALFFQAAEALGVSAKAFEMSRQYALVREQFGKPIGLFQATKHKLADGLIRVENARSALFGAQRTYRDGVIDARSVRLAKVVSVSGAVEMVSEAIQIHGAIGCTWEFPLHLLLRRAKLCELSLGSPQQHLHALGEALATEPAPGRNRSSPTHQLAEELALGQADLTFLESFQTWLDKNAPAHVEAIRDASAFDKRIDALRNWQGALADGGWAGIHWPLGFNGLDATSTQQVLYHTELAARRLPPLIGNRGLSLVGPTLMIHGTPWQKETFIEATRRADILWASGLSEPGSGSDLASLRTRAVVEGDRVVVNGQKIWTSGAHYTDYMFTLVRTGPLEPKHAGITCLLIKLDLPGITIRPIRRINGTPEFNEVFLDNVEVPVSCIVGEVNDGWHVAKTTLKHEHMTNFLGAQLRQSFFMDRILSKFRAIEHDKGTAPWLRPRIAQSWINTQLLRLHGLRSMDQAANSDGSGAEGSILKLFGQEEERRIYELALDVLGPEGLTTNAEARGFLGAKAATIGGGTSEIHRNKIAERVLGMPRDPWADPAA